MVGVEGCGLERCAMSEYVSNVEIIVCMSKVSLLRWRRMALS
jgi:hypothetical protein